MSVLAVDPGVTGGIALIDGPAVEVHAMPETRAGLVELLRRLCPDVAYVEQVSASPQMGVVSAFSFGGSYERPLAILATLGIRVEEVRPQKWQKALGLQGPPSVVKRRKKTDPPWTKEERRENQRLRGHEQRTHKNVLRNKAEQLFPGVPMTLDKADAILIAEYGRRKELGLL